jgi:hypothetical protein
MRVAWKLFCSFAKEVTTPVGLPAVSYRGVRPCQLEDAKPSAQHGHILSDGSPSVSRSCDCQGQGVSPLVTSQPPAQRKAAALPHRSASIPPSRRPAVVQSQDTPPHVDRRQRPSRPADHLGGIELPQQRGLSNRPRPTGFRRSGSPSALGSAHLRPGFGCVLTSPIGFPCRLHGGACRPRLAPLGSCELGARLVPSVVGSTPREFRNCRAAANRQLTR